MFLTPPSSLWLMGKAINNLPLREVKTRHWEVPGLFLLRRAEWTFFREEDVFSSLQFIKSYHKCRKFFQYIPIISNFFQQIALKRRNDTLKERLSKSGILSY